jgi:TatD DNase family protein
MNGKMKFVDVHCHLEGERFEKDLDDIVKRANDMGVCLIINSGVNPEANRKVLELTKKYSIIKASFGLYPIDSVVIKFKNLNDDYPRAIEAFDYKDELRWIEKNIDKCVSIGEIGLDFKVIEGHENFEEIKKEQIKVFEDVIEFAKKFDKPIVVHTRGAELECIEILEKHSAKKVVLHCFGGKKSLIKRGADNGWYFSVPAVIKRLHHFQTLVGMVNIKQLLTETDAPYLAPVAGERSEPRDVVGTIEEIAKIKGLKSEDVAKQILDNAVNIFGVF